MRSLLVACLLALPALCVLHEKRNVFPASYALSDTVLDPSTPLPTPLRFFLLQSNLDLAPSALLNVSSPASRYFRSHWTRKEVDAFFRPSPASGLAVERWLATSGIPPSSIKRSRSGGSVDVSGLTVGDAQRLLNTTYSLYTHTSGSTQHLGCTEYHLPSHIAKHVDFVYPTLQFDGHAVRQGRLGKRGPQQLGVPGSGSLPKQGGPDVSQDQLGEGMSVCGEFIVPACLEQLYNIPPPDLTCSATPSLHLGIVEYTPQSYLPSDLDSFFQYYLPPAVGARPQLLGIDGGFLQTEYDGFDYHGESDLDFQYGMALSWPEMPALYQVGDMTGSASFGNFLDGIDGEYCTYEGGDDPEFDESFPNPYGYDQPEDCGTVPQTTVISTSYNYNEIDLTPSYMQRQCNEYLKLGLQGVTVVFSSGDYGVAGNENLCIDRSTGYIDYSGTMFAPSFPSTCPWVLSVGATQIPYGVVDPFGQPEVACQRVITSGGGFSNVFSRPAYQDKAVGDYLSNYPPDSSMDYNKDYVRAYPDISANGAAYLIAIDGGYETVYGTSASAPVVASMIAKINSALASQGNAPIGFINPVLYGDPGRVNDIVSGSNPGCGTEGFSTAPGWDPVTGMGTINYEMLYQFYTSLG
ncbi:subtilisin-like protein [Calocera viscosa TUFC12733]|uniref:tripeptidyl-peptidase II n=1 Tax=Calocera viscosa (strain TUFC12733) TaxID=1330018 RepID=A0A167RTS6_CALVF|nr:subtilisin-like protein [Calocera viscosa TUFC12733]